MASDKSSKDSTVKKAPEGGVMTRSKTAKKGEHSSVDPPPSGGIFDKAIVTVMKLWPSEPQPAPVAKYRFKVGDRVMMDSSQNVTVRGTVRWIGPIMPSKESKIDTPVVFAGIETVSTVLSYNTGVAVVTFDDNLAFS